MDRLTGDINVDDEGSASIDLTQADAGVIGTPDGDGAGFLLQRATERLAIPQRLLALDELDVLYDPAQRALWTYMNPAGRPSFTHSLLGDFETWQSLIASHFGPSRIPLDYLVLGSRSPGVFCFGGDLDLFRSLIIARNRDGLAAYGRRCVEILHRNIRALDLPMLTVGLVQGQALGGGFEAVLSFDVIVAEKGSTFGLPEVMFGLFPGMGAHAILVRKLGEAMAERIITGNRTWSAEEMHALGIVHHLAEPGCGEEAVRDFMAKSSRRLGGLVGARRAMREASPLPLSELVAIVDHWADAAISLTETDLRLMQRLVSAQQKLAKTG